MRALLFLVALLVPGLARADDFLDGPKNPTATGVPMRYAARPIVTPFRSMEVFGDLVSRRQLPLDPQFYLQTGARHGLFENTELGILLWPILFKDGLQLAGPPSFFSSRRVPLGALELAFYGRVAIPLVVTSWEGEAAVLAQLKLADTLRVDTALVYRYIEVAFADRHAVSAPLRLSVQIGDSFRVSGIAGFQVARAPAGRPANVSTALALGAELAYTVPEPAGGAFCDIVLGASLPEVYASYDKPDGIFSAWAVTLSGKFFFNFGHSSWENDRFID